jgi:hypothetical protein
MLGDTGEALTQPELDALALKVEDWSRGLTWKERAFMAEVIIRAANSEPADIQGYGLGFYAPEFESPANVVNAGDSLPAPFLSFNFQTVFTTSTQWTQPGSAPSEGPKRRR